MPLDIEAIEIIGCDSRRLAELRRHQVDRGGNDVAPFTDREGGWPLGCCLVDSRPGEQLAIVVWSPFPWQGAYAEVGPIVIHAADCSRPVGDGVPPQFLSRRQLARPHGHDRRIVYDQITIVAPDGSLPAVLAGLLAYESIDFVHVRNLLSRCYSFTARRHPPTAPDRAQVSGKR